MRIPFTTVLFVSFCPLLAWGQAPEPNSPQTGDESNYVPITIGYLGITIPGKPGHEGDSSSLKISFFESVRGNAQGSNLPVNYAFAPYFTFLSLGAAKDGTDKRYEVYDNDNGTRNIKMRLAFFDDKLRTAAAAFLSEKKGVYISPTAVQPLPIWRLQVTEQLSKLAILLPEGINPATQLDLSPVQDVFFSNIRAQLADQFIKAVDTGNTNFTFEYSYKKAGTSIGSYTVRLDDISTNSQFQQVTGNGGSGLVTRNGAIQLASVVATSLDVSAYIEDDSIKASLSNDIVDLFINKLKFKETLDFSKAEQLKALSSLSIDPKGVDFEADRISRTHDAVTSSHDFNELNKKLIDAGATGGYDGFTAGANFKSDDEVNKAIRDTFSEDWSGNDWKSVPKTINVFQLNSSDFSGSAIIRQVAVKPIFGMVSYQIGVQQGFPSMAILESAIQVGNADRFVLVPIGSVIAFGGMIDSTHALPGNYLPCDGTALRSSEFPELFRVIGSAHGDGSEQRGIKVSNYDFNLPDYRGLFLRGVDSGSNRDQGPRKPNAPGAASGDSVGSFEPDDLKSHRHDLGVAKTDYTVGGSSNGLRGDDFFGKGWYPMGMSYFPAPPDGKETRPANSSVFWIIRVR